MQDAVDRTLAMKDLAEVLAKQARMLRYNAFAAEPQGAVAREAGILSDDILRLRTDVVDGTLALVSGDTARVVAQMGALDRVCTMAGASIRT